LLEIGMEFRTDFGEAGVLGGGCLGLILQETVEGWDDPRSNEVDPDSEAGFSVRV
jgi:hypothetical protein